MTDFNIQEYFDKIEVATKLDELIDRYKIEKKKEDIIRQILIDYFSGKIKEDELDLAIQEKANLNFNLVLDLTYDLENELFPLLPENVVRQAGVSEPVQAKLEDIIKAIEKQAKLKISERYEKRFEDIIFNWFRDIRDDSETLDILTRSNKIGGLGLKYSEGQNLLKILKNIEASYANQGVKIRDLISQELEKEKKVFKEKEAKEEEIDVAAKVKRPEETETKITGADITIDQLLKDKGMKFAELSKKEAIKKELMEEEKKAQELTASPLIKKIEDEEEFLESREEITPPPPALTTKEEKEPEKKIETKPVPKPEPVSQPVMPPVTSAPSAPQTEEKQPFFKKPFSEARPKIEDVKFAAKLYGPIDELAAFKIEDLRRLSKDPKSAIDKIKDKLDLLEEESIVKRTEGIKALKSSPLYKTYADIMNRAIKQGKSFDQILKENPIITLEEFRAIMELNKSLKY